MHKHLTWTDRLKIEKALKEGLKPCKIADRLHVHNSTIYRELKRGTYTHLNSDLTTEERYSPEIAEARYRENLAAKGGELKIGSDHELAAFIEKKIGEEGYSPAAVVGEIKRLGLTFKTEISEKTIYNYIDKGIFFGISRESLPEKGKRKRTKVYYCHPYSAFERGTNENINRMIRRFLPKGTDFRKVTAAYILRVETWINNYPREILGFASSNDLFAAHLAAA